MVHQEPEEKSSEKECPQHFFHRVLVSEQPGIAIYYLRLLSYWQTR